MHISNALLTYALVATSAASIVKRQDGDDTADSSNGGDGGCMVACEAAANEAVEGHCDNTTWTGLLDDCLGCANTAGFWADYETEVQSNAGDCGLPAEPLPSAIEDGDDGEDGLPDSDTMPDTGPDADMDDSSPDSDTMPDTGEDADTDDGSPDSTTPDNEDMDDSSPDSTASTQSPAEDSTTETSPAADDSGAGALAAPFITSALVGVVAALFAYAL